MADTPHDVPVRVDHVGIAVESVADAEPVLELLGCERLNAETVADTYRWVYYRLGDASRIELIEPVGDGETFLTRYLDAHGPGLHHVTLEVAAIDPVVDHLESADVRVVDYREYDDWTEAFVSPQNPTGALFQLMEYHDTFPGDREAGSELFVHGTPLERTDD